MFRMSPDASIFSSRIMSRCGWQRSRSVCGRMRSVKGSSLYPAMSRTPQHGVHGGTVFLFLLADGLHELWRWINVSALLLDHRLDCVTQGAGLVLVEAGEV